MGSEGEEENLGRRKFRMQRAGGMRNHGLRDGLRGRNGKLEGQASHP